MPMLHTANDRAIYRIQREIEQREVWLAAEMRDRRAAAFHRAKIAELQAELNQLQEMD